MRKGHLLLAGITGLGGFGLGYLTGQSGKAAPSRDAASSSASHASAHKNSPSSSDSPATKSHPRSTTTDATPNPEKGFSRRIVDMMSKGELTVNGVDINAETFMPGQAVKDFLNLTDPQLETLKQIGRDRMQARQQHEQSILTMVKSTANEIVFDIPADPAFAAAQEEAFIESLRTELGPDVAAVLQGSIGMVYGDFENPRHVRYTLTPLPDPVDENARGEVRKIQEGLRNFRTEVNQNDDGTYMKDDRGVTLRGSQTTAGTMQLYNPTPDPWIPRYHYLWEQQQKN